ncbi:MAG TPA: PPK2 family polyphosphate kinase [Chthoniobacterales bacterium]|nr:PPK2 family polyphosphate kinase [Chthoniobacterales bacterium]
MAKKQKLPNPKKIKGIVLAGPGCEIRLSKIDAAETAGHSKSASAEKIERLRERLAELQEALYAEHQRSLLVVVQGTDTSGKDGAIKNLCLGLDPNGVQLTNFKYPTAEERDHDFLWRVHRAAPRKGAVGLWNRSHYEDVLVPLVHGEITKETWRARCADINAFEKLLNDNGVTILKFFLHISKEEQKCRLEARLKEPRKLWKFNLADLQERRLWEDYQMAYDDVINSCTTAQAPWWIVPADRKWLRNLVMLETVVAALERMDPKYPAAEFDPKDVAID